MLQILGGALKLTFRRHVDWFLAYQFSVGLNNLWKKRTIFLLTLCLLGDSSCFNPLLHTSAFGGLSNVRFWKIL